MIKGSFDFKSWNLSPLIVGTHRFSAIGEMMFSIFHVASQGHMINGHTTLRVELLVVCHHQDKFDDSRHCEIVEI